MRHVIAQVTRRIRVERAQVTAGLALVALLGAAACDKEVTAPVQREPNVRPTSVFTITPGLTAYTSRAAWEAAVVAASSTPQLFNFTGLTQGRVTQLDTDYSTFHLTVDRVSANSFNNPGIDIFPDVSCGIESGDCNRFVFGLLDPDILTGDAPRINTLVFPQSVNAFFGYFYQTGYTAGGTPSVTGPVTLHFGAESVVLNDYLDNTGTGFFGVVSTVPSTTISFTFEQSFSLQNDIVELYNPTYAFAPAPPPPDDPTVEEQMAALREYLDSINPLKGNLKPLDKRVNKVDRALDRETINKACQELGKFVKDVEKKSGKTIPASDASALIGMAAEIQTAIGCGV